MKKFLFCAASVAAVWGAVGSHNELLSKVAYFDADGNATILECAEGSEVAYTEGGAAGDGKGSGYSVLEHRAVCLNADGGAVAFYFSAGAKQNEKGEMVPNPVVNKMQTDCAKNGEEWECKSESDIKEFFLK